MTLPHYPQADLPVNTHPAIFTGIPLVPSLSHAPFSAKSACGHFANQMSNPDMNGVMKHFLASERYAVVGRVMADPSRWDHKVGLRSLVNQMRPELRFQG